MGKKAKPLHIGEPHINGYKATPYNTFHLNWQTRISKERNAALPEGWDAADQRPQQPALGEEFFPIGAGNSLNNSSKGFAMTFGGGSWHASGGIRSMHRDGFGCPAARDKAILFRTGTLRPEPRASRASSLGKLGIQAPNDASVKAEVMRAMMNRSVASVLRNPNPEEFGDGLRLARLERPSSEPQLALEETRRIRGGHGRAPGHASISAEVMRAMPYRSVASVLRHPDLLPVVDPRTPSPAVERDPGIMGKADFRRPGGGSIKAEVMRGMMNRSVATVLRDGYAEVA